MYQLRVQDPASAETRYLDEEILAILLDPTFREVHGMFAFASARAVTSLIDDPAFDHYMAGGGILRLLVGLDAITDRRALEVLRDVALRHQPDFEVRVFKNTHSNLFHPKLVRALRDDGSGRLIVGSGNLTPGGLRRNVEAYSVLDLDRGMAAASTELDRFLVDHAAEISEIDDEALEQGDRNASRLAAARVAPRIGRGRRRVPSEEPAEIVAAGEEQQEEVGPIPALSDRMLVAQVPRASGRWNQVHFNREAIRDYFRAAPHSADRVLLHRLEPGGYVTEQPRPVVLSGRNLNHKIEFAAHHGEPYPASGPPILVLRELGLRSHSYLMLLPGEPGYAEMSAFLASRPSIGRGDLRVIADRADIAVAWPGMPL